MSSEAPDPSRSVANAADPGRFDSLFVGDPAPWFRQACIGQDGLFSFDMVAGRFVALCFYGSASERQAQAALALARQHSVLFDGARRSFFGVSCSPEDLGDPQLAPRPGQRHFADFDGAVSRAYGVAAREGGLDVGGLRRGWFVLDPRLRLIARFPLGAEGDAAAIGFLSQLPSPADYQARAQTPVLEIPGVFEPEFCDRLIALHLADGGAPSNILTEGAVVADPGFKRRRDCRILDPALLAQTQTRIFRRVVPQIRHAFQFNATRLERLVVACYDAADRGRFGPHRDNTVAATAHRRFAVSINLNADFEGGGISFPEYSQTQFRPPVGAALVFSCSLMHAVAPMTHGRRYACLPFVYDDAAAELRRRGTQD